MRDKRISPYGWNFFRFSLLDEMIELRKLRCIEGKGFDRHLVYYIKCRAICFSNIKSLFCQLDTMNLPTKVGKISINIRYRESEGFILLNPWVYHKYYKYCTKCQLNMKSCAGCTCQTFNPFHYQDSYYFEFIYLCRFLWYNLGL